MMSKQKPTLCSGAQKCHPYLKSTASSVQCDSSAVFVLLGRHSPWISTSWPDSEHEISEGDEKAERGREEKKAWFVEGNKMDAPSWQCSGAFLPSDSRFSHKTWDDVPPTAPVLVRLGTSGLVSHHQAEICTERTTNGVCWGDLRKVGRDAHCSTRGIPGMLPKLEEMLGAMYKDCRRKGTKPNFSKISKQTVYLNFSGPLRTDSEASCPNVFVVFFSPSSTWN